MTERWDINQQLEHLSAEFLTFYNRHPLGGQAVFKNEKGLKRFVVVVHNFAIPIKFNRAPEHPYVELYFYESPL